MVMVSSARWPASSLILLSSAARSWLPGWYCLIGSLTGTGVLETASIYDRSWRSGLLSAFIVARSRAGHLGWAADLRLAACRLPVGRCRPPPVIPPDRRA